MIPLGYLLIFNKNFWKKTENHRCQRNRLGENETISPEKDRNMKLVAVSVTREFCGYVTAAWKK